AEVFPYEFYELVPAGSHRGVRAAVAGVLSARDQLQRPHGTHPSRNSFCASAPVIEATASGFSPASATILAGSSSPIGNGMSEPIITRSAPITSTTNRNARGSCRMLSV